VRFQVPIIASMKTTAFWDIVLYNLTEVGWRMKCTASIVRVMGHCKHLWNAWIGDGEPKEKADDKWQTDCDLWSRRPSKLSMHWNDKMPLISSILRGFILLYIYIYISLWAMLMSKLFWEKT
jgi:hypothetical protein